MDSKYVDDLIDDDEVPELTEEDVARSIPFSQLPADLQHTLREIQKGNVEICPDGQPSRSVQRAPVKKPISIRLSADVLEGFKATGSGWQTRMDEALREHLREKAKKAS